MNPHILILAAGMGKRMRSRLPKVLHSVLGRPMLHHIIDTALQIPHREIGVVVGHGEEAVREACREFPQLKFYVQKEQRGTGDAVRAAESRLAKEPGDVLVLSGDVMLLRAETLVGLLAAHTAHAAACTIATAVVPHPTGYGRILRDGERVQAIREEVDCSPEEKKVAEINSGIYCFQIGPLFQSLLTVQPNNRQGEFYLTDVPAALSQKKQGVFRYPVADAAEITGINDRKALYEVEQVLKQRVIEKWWREGVTIEDPASTLIDVRSRLGRDVVIESGARIVSSEIGDNVHIESQSRIEGSRVGSGVHIKQGSYIKDSRIEDDVTVGPYAHLRPESVLGSGVKIGNFVEIKKSTFGKGSKASHLAYIGDATIGENCNLGCGFITCNYDGKRKHQTIIEDNVFVGSDSQIVAPVTLGKGTYVASGTTVTRSAPADSLVMARVRQETKLGYAKRLRGS